MLRDSFITTTRGLRRDTPPMRLFEKAKQFGTWNPSTIEFSKDKEDWQKLADDERDILLHLTTLFQAGEEAVTLDLLPLMMVIASEGRLEEEMFLTTFLYDEAKHTDFFRRFLDEVAGVQDDLSHYHSGNYHLIFSQALPQNLQRLTSDPSPRAQAIASATYNMIVEGILAETGYHAYFTVLEAHDILPGQQQGIAYLKQDESRHIAYGVYLLSRLVAADPSIWDEIETTMNTLVIPALGIINDTFERHDPIPFGLSPEVFTEFAMDQFQKRYARLEKAKSQTLEEIMTVTRTAIDSGDV
jgi:ribonucleoside-diphosphate reductase beta chain